jgi:hypothetical protein
MIGYRAPVASHILPSAMPLLPLTIWSTAATSPAITITQPGNYCAPVPAPGNCTSQSHRTGHAKQPMPLLPEGRCYDLRCSPLLLRISAVAAPGTTYRWSNGSTAAMLLVQAKGLYGLARSLAGGIRSASRHISSSSYRLIPSIVPPDGDGLNKQLPPAGLAGNQFLDDYNREDITSTLLGNTVVYGA